MKLQNLMLGIVVFSVFISLGYSVFAALGSSYNKELGSVSTTDLDRLEEISSISSETQETIMQTAPSGEWSDTPVELVTGAFNVVKSLFALPHLLVGTITEIVRLLKLPASIGLALSSILGVLVVWQIVSILMKWEV